MRRALLVTGALALLAGGCGGGDNGNGNGAPGNSASGPDGPTSTTVRTTRVEVVKGLGGGGFDPEQIYKREAPGVVTVISVFQGGASSLLGSGDGQAGQGSGFVISRTGEVATNAHVVTSGRGRTLKRAKEVYVQFGDDNQVPAKIVGVDPNADVALLRVATDGLSLTPLPFGSSSNLEVGAPVAAIGSPFGEPQSLSVGVISALDRTIESLTSFQIPGAIQTDAAINHGNSGGPLVDAHGQVLGINSQIQSTGGGGEGVGFAVPVNTVRSSLDQLRRSGAVHYAYLGVSTVPIFPQLAKRFDLPVDHGVWVQIATAGGPAQKAGIKGGGSEVRFQAQPYKPGGDVIVKVADTPIRSADALSKAVAQHRPGEKVAIELYRGSDRRTVTATLAERPAGNPASQAP
jgi:S1-C subfamily serine protease